MSAQKAIMFGGAYIRLVAMIGAFALLCGLAAPAWAQGPVGEKLQVCLLRDTGGMRAATLIREPERFDCRTPQHELGPGDFWAVSSEIGLLSRPADPLTVRYNSLWQAGVSLHVLYADGAIVSAHTDARGIAPYIQLGAIAEQRLPPRTAPVVRLLWHVEGAANMRGVMKDARISTVEQGRASNLSLAAAYGLFGGLCLALIVYNLALWGALRHRFQLFYCLMVGALALYAFSSSGAMAWLFPELGNNIRLRTNYLMLGAAAASALVFARNFFEPRIFAGWLGRYTTAATIGLAGVGAFVFAFASLAPRLVDHVFSSVFLSLSVVTVATLWRAWRLRSNYLWLFAIGWGAPILTATLRLLSNFNLFPVSFWLDNSTILAMVVEALISSLAIAYRMKLLRDERDEAITREVLARRLADTDPLTGLLNRRAFLAAAIGRDGEHQLLIVDIDHFKRVNETLGHDGGDEVLRLFARALRAGAATTTLLARLGGEEFALLTPGEAALDPDWLLGRLRNARMPFDITVTASIGVCSGPVGNEPEWKRLYRGADSALFEAKAAGRDRVRSVVRAAA